MKKKHVYNRLSDVLEKEYKKIVDSDGIDAHAAYGIIMDLAEKAILLDFIYVGAPKAIEYAGDVLDVYAVECTSELDEYENEIIYNYYIKELELYYDYALKCLDEM